jgi:hypothetical protein
MLVEKNTFDQKGNCLSHFKLKYARLSSLLLYKRVMCANGLILPVLSRTLMQKGVSFGTHTNILLPVNENDSTQ